MGAMAGLPILTSARTASPWAAPLAGVSISLRSGLTALALFMRPSSSTAVTCQYISSVKVACSFWSTGWPRRVMSCPSHAGSSRAIMASWTSRVAVWALGLELWILVKTSMSGPAALLSFIPATARLTERTSSSVASGL